MTLVLLAGGGFLLYKFATGGGFDSLTSLFGGSGTASQPSGQATGTAVVTQSSVTTTSTSTPTTSSAQTNPATGQLFNRVLAAGTQELANTGAAGLNWYQWNYYINQALGRDTTNYDGGKFDQGVAQAGSVPSAIVSLNTVWPAFQSVGIIPSGVSGIGGLGRVGALIPSRSQSAHHNNRVTGAGYNFRPTRRYFA